jgi:hypothetical protein
LFVRVIKWARARRPRPLAQSVSVPADDKLRCQRLFLAPYAALVVRRDGALFRVADVRKAGGEGGACVIDLVRGVDEYLLAAQPLPVDAAIERALKGHCDLRVSADAFDAPEWPAIVPCFFGGVLALTNGIEVRVVDADFGGESTSRYGAIFGGQMLGALAKRHGTGYGASTGLASGVSSLGSALGRGLGGSGGSGFFGPREEEEVGEEEGFGLRYVRLSLVDGSGEVVGHAVWVDVHEVLALLKTVVTPTCDAEETLRKQARFELHRAEQKRLALAALRMARDDPNSAFAVDESSQEGGVGALLKQLDAAAPTPILAGGRLSHKAAAALSSSGSSGDLHAARVAKAVGGKWSKAGAGAALRAAQQQQGRGGRPATSIALASRALAAGAGGIKGPAAGGRGGGVSGGQKHHASAPSLAPAPSA